MGCTTSKQSKGKDKHARKQKAEAPKSPENKTASSSSKPASSISKDEPKQAPSSKTADKPSTDKPKDNKSKPAASKTNENKPASNKAESKKDDSKQNTPNDTKPSAAPKAAKDEKDDGETASQETDRLYKKYMAEVDEHAALRKKYFDDASKAHDSGDGKLAKELSEKGKAETAKMEEAKVKAANAIYAGKNKNNEVNIMDLHGLQVEMAIKIVEEKLKICKQKNFETADVIHGKGNHSGADGPKVKGAIRKWLDDNGYKGKWTEISDGGAVQVSLK